MNQEENFSNIPLTELKPEIVATAITCLVGTIGANKLLEHFDHVAESGLAILIARFAIALGISGIGTGVFAGIHLLRQANSSRNNIQ
jgi:hypothetical protein